MSTKYVQARRATLLSSISDSATSCTLTGFLDLSANTITQTDIGTIGYGTFAPNTDKEEAISFTIDSNTAGEAVLTIVRGLLGKAPYGTGGTAFAHNAGTEFIISNNPDLFNKMTAKDNDEIVTGAWQFPAPTADQSPATKLFVEEIVNGGTVSVNRTVVAGTAGATVASGDLVYFDTTDAEWKKTAGATATTLDGVQLGIAQGSGVDGGAIAGGVLIFGLDSTQTGMTPGALQYAGDTAGAIVETAGTIEKVIGEARSATELYFDPKFYSSPTAGEKAALAGGGDFGTPSTSNKFVTEEYIPATYTPPEVVVFTASGTWTKDAGLKYVIVEGVGGGGGADNDFDDAQGSGGGYFRKLIPAADLGATETVTVGAAAGRTSSAPYPDGGNTSFGSHATGNGGTGGGAGGTATGGDINIQGQAGRSGSSGTGGNYVISGSSMLGLGGIGNSSPTGYGSGANDSFNSKPGIVIVTEYYS